jgi:lysine N6-hydroxylase
MTHVHDLVGVGIGPFNLGLAALADGAPDIDARFLERETDFRWHPGLLLQGTRLQVPFLADLVTLIDPTSRWSLLAYLRAHERLFPFYFAERFHVPRREYDDYCRWVAHSLASCSFGVDVLEIDWDTTAGAFAVHMRHGEALAERLLSRNVVLGIGTEPSVPVALRALLGHGAIHAADYLDHRDRLLAAVDVTVVGSGQSGAEVFLDLLRAAPAERRLRWLTRTPAFAPMEYSKLGLEHFTPAYTDYFRELPGDARSDLLARQWQLYKAISADTIADIHELLYERGIGGSWPEQIELRPCTAVESAHHDRDSLLLRCHERHQDRRFELRTDAVVLATGYAPRDPACLEPLNGLLRRGPDRQLVIDELNRVALAPEVTGRLYVQNAELHTHGVGAPDLGLGAHRSAMILNDIAGRTVHSLPRRTAFTSFGAPA